LPDHALDRNDFSSKSSPLSGFLFEHDLFGEPASTPDRTLARIGRASSQPLASNRRSGIGFIDLKPIFRATEFAEMRAIRCAASFALAAIAACLLVLTPATARDDGRYSNDPLHAWFDQLASDKGLCCSFADGFSVRDVDWDTQNGRYRVKLHGEWIVVPDDAVVKEPNRFGPAVVWPYMDVNGATQIRCFMPGAGA
jgi:hypothetical protein